ncbi:putative MKL/myocardin-like protein 1 isoform X1 [Apostichopus japonicus]|uniref:Putative MKL/myocardin-like protein 1 isoform X1 n=1 Tax=Stichopus japonicus TaxID=307972 RepID=A0A2G8L1C3_STIJA|nr:putative MKL/myocardin-like protein 1 isoform X1 [Apostichopus japonicus]
MIQSIQVVDQPLQQQQQQQQQQHQHQHQHQQLPQQQQQPQPVSQENLLKFGQDMNTGGITLNCGNNQTVQNLLGQFLNPLAQQAHNGTTPSYTSPDGSFQLINTNGGILQNLPTGSNNISLTTDTNSAPVTTPFVLQQANQAGATQPMLLNPNTFLLNPGATVSPQTFILNPIAIPNQANPTAANNTTFFVASANLGSGNTTFLTNLNTAPLQTTVDANAGGGGNNATVLLTAPPNVGGDPNAILLQPETKTNVPVTPTSVGPADVKPFNNSGLRRSLGTRSSQKKTVQELLKEDEQKRVQVDSEALDLEKTRDTLALRLKLRRPRNELVDQGIIPSTAFKSSPAFHEQLQRLERAKVGDHLQKKMRMRPDKAQLVHHHILEDTNLDPIVNARQQMLKRARLEQDLDIKIKNRPGPLELIEGNILKPETEVEQYVKDGSLRFFKTSGSDPESPFTFYDTTDGSDEALSPPQPDTSTSDTQPSSVNSIPSPSDTLFFSDKMKPIANAQTSPHKMISSTVPGLTIKQEQGVTSPPGTGSSLFSVLTSSSSSCKNSSSSSSRNQRKKQAKRSKPKEIKFHEYKPPNEQGSKAGSQPQLGNPYNLLLMQQQLYLQLQLLQQQQRVVPTEQSNLATSCSSNSSSSSASVTVSNPSTTKLPSPTVQQTLSASASPSQSDVKITTSNNNSSSSSNSNIITTSSSSTNSSTATTTATSTTATKTFSLAHIEDMKVSELKAELKNRGLHVSGTKPQLVQRLRTAELTAQAGSIAGSPDVMSSVTKVTSSTDVHIDSLSDCNSNRQSLTSPPVSPLDAKAEPMSPSSPQFESPTFQPVKTPSISSPVSNPSSLTFQNLAHSQEQKRVEEMTMSPPASAGSLHLRSPPPSGRQHRRRWQQHGHGHGGSVRLLWARRPSQLAVVEAATAEDRRVTACLRVITDAANTATVRE